MNYSKDEKILKKILKAIINSTAGLKHAIIIDDTGITILSESKFRISDDGISVEKIGAIGGAVFVAGEEQGQILGYGKIRVQITEYEEGMIFSVKTGRGILCVAADNNVQIGFVRAILKKWAPKIAMVLERHLKSDQEVINKELKELFNSDTISLL
ncbi:MAG: Regulator protein [Promethearchaeota archaeon]|nr:MAG: Regulator protein [Candidatus Lokiarchaeota archaeon]